MIGVFKDELEKESFGVFLYSVYKFRYRGRLLEEKIYDQQKILAEPQRTDANAEEYDFALSLLEQFRDKKAAK